MNKNQKIIAGGIAGASLCILGVVGMMSMTSPSEGEVLNAVTQSVNEFSPLFTQDGRGGYEWYFDIPCNDSKKFDINFFSDIINNPEKCECVSVFNKLANLQGGGAHTRIGLLGSDGIRYAASKENYELLCPEGRFVAKDNGNLYMIGECSDAVALGYGGNANNPGQIFSFNEFESTCPDGGENGESCESNEECASGNCEEKTIGACASGNYGEKLSCAGFTTQEQCLGFKQNVGPKEESVSVCIWDEITLKVCADKEPYCDMSVTPNPANVGEPITITVNGYFPGADIFTQTITQANGGAGYSATGAVTGGFGSFPIIAGYFPGNDDSDIAISFDIIDTDTGKIVACGMRVPVTPAAICGNGKAEAGESCGEPGLTCPTSKFTTYTCNQCVCEPKFEQVPEDPKGGSDGRSDGGDR